MTATIDVAAERLVRRPSLRKSDGSAPFVMIDAFNLSTEKGTGVATYARNLSYCLRDLGCEVGVLYGSEVPRGCDPLLKEVLFHDVEPENGRLQRFGKRLLAVARGPRNIAFQVPLSGAVVRDGLVKQAPFQHSLWNASHLYTRAASLHNLLGITSSVTSSRKPDLCHWTYPVPIRFRGVPNVYTVHDVIPIRLPYTTLDRKARYLKLLRWICRTADHIVTVSESSKRDIIEVLGVDGDKITNTYQTVVIPDELVERPDQVVEKDLRRLFGLGFRNYFLFFGSIEPKKNLARLLEGYLASGSSAPLVIVGAQEWRSKRELRLLSSEFDSPSSILRDGRVLRMEYVPFAWLVTLIRGAKAVVFPSLYEGFGLPVLESMLLGTPVITSKVGATAEVAGDAALLIDPYETSEIARAISAVDGDASLCERLRSTGLERAKAFTAAQYQERLASVYSRVMQREARRISASR